MTQSDRLLGEPEARADLFAALTLAAAVPVMRVYGGPVAARLKPDASPVTAADEEAEAIILDGLARALPGIPVVSEEAVATCSLPVAANDFILVDPLDGTREFLARNDEFTVNIAWIRAGVPVCAAVFAPARDRLWIAGAQAFVCAATAGGAVPGASARRPARTRAIPAQGLRALVSRSHRDQRMQPFLDRLPLAETRPMGSSLKYCLMAEGEADVAPRFGPTMEWDTAAADCILRAAGGCLVTADGAPLRYGKFAAGLKNPDFIAWADPAAARRWV
jgi:3'(2'),5'-bisphosphate nucleotidase